MPRRKRSQPDHNSPTKDASEKRAKENQPATPTTCPVCDTGITEDTDDVAGDDAVYCEGTCATWLHRRCVSMSKSMYDKLGESEIPYLCPNCMLSKQSNEITELKNLIKALTTQVITALTSQLAQSVSASAATIAVDNSITKSIPNSSHQVTRPSPRPASQTPPQSERKFNVVIYGLPESQHGKPRLVRATEDLNKTSETLSKIDSNLGNLSIRDCFRLGKYEQQHSRPRPVLVKLNRSVDTITILTKQSQYPTGIVIKPDLSPQERNIQRIVMSERWKLIQSGIDRKQIKIRASSIYISGKLHGSVEGSQFKGCHSSSVQASSQDSTGTATIAPSPAAGD